MKITAKAVLNQSVINEFIDGPHMCDTLEK